MRKKIRKKKRRVKKRMKIKNNNFFHPKKKIPTISDIFDKDLFYNVSFDDNGRTIVISFMGFSPFEMLNRMSFYNEIDHPITFIENDFQRCKELDTMYQARSDSKKIGGMFKYCEKSINHFYPGQTLEDKFIDYDGTEESGYYNHGNLGRLLAPIAAKYQIKWNSLYDATIAQYNPIENYNMKENGTETATNKRTDDMELTKNDTTNYGRTVKQDETISQTTDGLVHNNVENTGTVKDDGTQTNTRTLNTQQEVTNNNTNKETGTVTTTLDTQQLETRDLTRTNTGETSTMRTDNLKDSENISENRKEDENRNEKIDETSDNTLTRDLTNSQNNVLQENRTEDGTNNTTYNITDTGTKTGSDTTNISSTKDITKNSDESNTKNITTTSSISAFTVLTHENDKTVVAESGQDTNNKDVTLTKSGNYTDEESYAGEELRHNEISKHDITEKTTTYDKYTESADNQEILKVEDSQQITTQFGKTITDTGNPITHTTQTENGTQNNNSSTQTNVFAFNNDGGGNASDGSIGLAITSGGSPTENTVGEDSTTFTNRTTDINTESTTDNTTTNSGSDTETHSGGHTDTKTISGTLLEKNGTITETERHDTVLPDGTVSYEQLSITYPTKTMTHTDNNVTEKTEEHDVTVYGKNTETTHTGSENTDYNKKESANTHEDGNITVVETVKETLTEENKTTYDTTETNKKTGTEDITTTMDVDNKKTETNTETQEGTEKNNGTKTGNNITTGVTTSSISAFRNILHTGTQDTVATEDTTEKESGTVSTKNTGTNAEEHDMSYTQNGTTTTNDSGTVSDDGTQSNLRTLNTLEKTTNDYNTDLSGTNTRDVTEGGKDTFTETVNTGRNISDNGNTEHTLTRSGNIGITTTQQMLTQEFEFRLLYDFYEIVFQDLDRELTLSVY